MDQLKEDIDTHGLILPQEVLDGIGQFPRRPTESVALRTRFDIISCSFLLYADPRCAWTLNTLNALNTLNTEV